MSSVIQLVRQQNPDLLARSFQSLRSPKPVEIPVRPYANRPLPLQGSGIALHEAFDRHNRAGWCDPACYPYIRAVRQWLDSVGVEQVLTEWNLYSRGSLPAGSCDALLHGGLNRFGIAELKVRAVLPKTPRPEDLFQIGEYGQLVAAWENCRPSHIWQALIYCSPVARTLRIFTWRDATASIAASQHCLQAA